MSEIERTEQRTLQFNRWARVHRDDFETKIEKNIYDFFAQNAKCTNQISNEDILNDLFGLNADNSKDKIISDDDINNFLANGIKLPHRLLHNHRQTYLKALVPTRGRYCITRQTALF